MDRHLLVILARLTKSSSPYLGQRSAELRDERTNLDDNKPLTRRFQVGSDEFSGEKHEQLVSYASAGGGLTITPPVAPDLRAALVASCLRGALPPVDFRAVCFVRAIGLLLSVE